MPGNLGRLVSADGAAFALVPVPDLRQKPFGDRALLVDVELLSPDRLVRYLARTVSAQFLAKLASAYLAAAEAQFPERSVAAVEEEVAGVAVNVVGSSAFDVELEVLIRADLDADIIEPDGLSFNVARTTLIIAAHNLRAWLDSDSGGEATP